MAKRKLLDDVKKREICAILSVGCSRRTAARYVGCSPTTVRRETQCDPDFRKRIDRAIEQAEVTWMQRIQNAAKEEKYWRAAAWALERCRPERYAARSPDAITVPQIVAMLSQLAEIIAEEIPVERYRKAVLRRFDALKLDIESAATHGRKRSSAATGASRDEGEAT